MSSHSFEQLRDFVENRMRMSHIYQPLLLRVLLKKRGQASVREIAAEFLSHDESQLEYYEHIAKVMPIRVLRSHGVVEYTNGQVKLAPGLTGLSGDETQELLTLCDQKLEEYKSKRGRAIWEHRTLALGEVPGTIRYEVLKRAGGRCELCGIPKEERALDVDHIIPRKHKGQDAIENFQALCWKCNANKGASDATDFRALHDLFDSRHQGCVFCEVPGDKRLFENSLTYAIRDAHPVTALHTLLIPKRHAPDFFGLFSAERNAVFNLMEKARDCIAAEDPNVEGFNIGINCGEAAGQTVPHCHVHLIPRRRGDSENPKGGIRAVIPGKADYLRG